jgi:hypothetical protein
MALEARMEVWFADPKASLLAEKAEALSAAAGGATLWLGTAATSLAGFCDPLARRPC